jgi:pantoate--beta-alanine ligase
MRRVSAVADLKDRLSAWRHAGERIAFVPTMGNLHAGHLRLIEVARRRAERVVASVFVNPLQFGANEDYGRYPRSLEADAVALAGAGCDLLFAPTVETMYPRGQAPLTRVVVPELADELEGRFRPGHFDGVATVVALLFNQVQPDLACFGEKDYQQLAVIRRMVADLQMPVEIVGVPTERAADGLALSSRNQYLSPEERQRAPGLYAELQAVAQALRAGAAAPAALEQAAMASLRRQGFVPEYVVIRSLELGAPQPPYDQTLVLAAARLGKTRLIDNLRVSAAA